MTTDIRIFHIHRPLSKLKLPLSLRIRPTPTKASRASTTLKKKAAADNRLLLQAIHSVLVLKFNRSTNQGSVSERLTENIPFPLEMHP